MKQLVKFLDTTLRDGAESAGVNFSLHDKTDIAKALERMGVDIIEAGEPGRSREDFDAVMAVSDVVNKSIVAALSKCDNDSVDNTLESLKNAKKKRLHIVMPVSDLHLKYRLKMSKDDCLRKIKSVLEYAKEKIDDIQITLEDSSRADKEFLSEAVRTSINAGAKTVSIADTVGILSAQEEYDLVKYIKENVPETENICLSVHCHNTLGQACANTLSGIKAGANQVEVTINGIGERSGNCALEEVLMSLKTKNDYYNAVTNLDTTSIVKTSKLVSVLSGISLSQNKPIVGKGAFTDENIPNLKNGFYGIMNRDDAGLFESGIILGKLSSKHAFSESIRMLGYQLGEKETEEAYKKFRILAEKKKEILDEDLEAIVSETDIKVFETYSLISFQVTSGNNCISTATVEIEKDGEKKCEASIGEGSVDAVFRAISKLVEMDTQIYDYKLRGVTQGQDALGEVSVTILYNNKKYKAKGVSTDIIEASVRAYMNCINKIAYLG